MRTFKEFATQRDGDIVVRYSSVDGFSKTQRFTDIQKAQQFAQKWVGKSPELGFGYAVSSDGVGKVTVQGTTLEKLFPDSAWQTEPYIDPRERVPVELGGPDEPYEDPDAPELKPQPKAPQAPLKYPDLPF